jgi:hypothetical protein
MTEKELKKLMTQNQLNKLVNEFYAKNSEIPHTNSTLPIAHSNSRFIINPQVTTTNSVRNSTRNSSVRQVVIDSRPGPSSSQNFSLPDTSIPINTVQSQKIAMNQINEKKQQQIIKKLKNNLIQKIISQNNKYLQYLTLLDIIENRYLTTLSRLNRTKGDYLTSQLQNFYNKKIKIYKNILTNGNLKKLKNYILYMYLLLIHKLNSRKANIYTNGATIPTFIRINPQLAKALYRLEQNKLQQNVFRNKIALYVNELKEQNNYNINKTRLKEEDKELLRQVADIIIEPNFTESSRKRFRGEKL